MANKAFNPIVDSEKLDAITKHFPSNSTRVSFPTIQEAIAKLDTILKDTNDAFGIPYAIKGTDDNGEVDPGVYEGSNAVLGYVGGRVDNPNEPGKQITGIKSLVIFPVPKIETLINAGDKGIDYLAKVFEKEAALVSFRSYRNAATTDEFHAGVKSAPGTVDEYLTASTSNQGMDMSTFDEVWPGFRDAVKKDMPALSKALPGKGECVKAMRSKSYAEANPDTAELEKRHMFVRILDQIIAVAKQNDLDTATLESWKENRDTVELSYKAPEKIDDYSFLDNVELNFAGDAGDSEDTQAAE